MRWLKAIQNTFAGMIPVGDESSRLERRLRAAPPLLIYQMGKVGSSSLKKSLSPIWPGLTIHAHNIARDKENRPDVGLVYERVIDKGDPVYVISPVREPIGRTVSAFFQNFERHTGVRYCDSTFSTEDLIEIFLRRCGHEGPLTWFERHFTPIFGIDVYQYEFPSDGVEVIKHGNTNVLLMRCELPDAVKEAAVKKFLNLAGFSLQNRNLGRQKEYAETYERFKQAFVPPDWYVSKMYDSRFFKHFYGAEKDTWVTRWTRRGTTSI
jgi:hypothetical protein